MPVQNLRGEERRRGGKGGGNVWTNQRAFVAIDARGYHPIVLALAEPSDRVWSSAAITNAVHLGEHASSGVGHPHWRTCRTEAAFLGTVPGYLHRDIGMRVPGENFETVLRDVATGLSSRDIPSFRGFDQSLKRTSSAV
jgi:hypothetical protein